MNRRGMLSALLGVAGMAGGARVAAQSAQPIRWVVGFAAGGGVDVLARAVAPEFGRALGRNVIIDNRPGAGGSLAAEHVAAAAPDGTTLLFADTTMLISPRVLGSVRYDSRKSFVPIGRLVQVPLALAVHASVPAATPQQFLAMVKAAPGRYSFGSAGIATIHHLGGELLKQTAGLDMAHVAYKGGAPAMQDLAGGQIPAAIVSVSAVLPHVKTGRVKLIAVLSEQRSAALPEVPALAETLPGFDATPSIFLVAPAGTPAATLDQLEAGLSGALAGENVAATLASQGAVAAALGRQALAAWLEREDARWGQVIQRSGIKLN